MPRGNFSPPLAEYGKDGSNLIVSAHNQNGSEYLKLIRIVQNVPNWYAWVNDYLDQ